MRKLPLLLLLFVFTSNIARSQETAAAPSTDKFRFGLHFSPNIGWEKTKNEGFSSNGGRLGFGFGLMAEFNLSQRYAFLTGLNVNKVNTSNIGSYTTENITSDINIQYVEIPLALKLKTNEIGYLTYFGKFGLAPSYNMRAKSTSNDVETNFIKQTQPVRLGLLIGIGTEYNISGSTRLLFGIDFNNGFTNMYTKRATFDRSGKKRSSINNFISLNIGVYF